MKFVDVVAKQGIDPEKTFTVELTLAEIAAIASLTGHSNSAKTAEKVERDHDEVLAEYVMDKDLNGKLYRDSVAKVREELDNVYL